MPEYTKQLLQRIRRPGAICFSFFALAGCAVLQPADPPPVALEAETPFEPLELIEIHVPQKRLPVAITLVPLGPHDVLDVLRDEFSLNYEENRRIQVQRDWYVRHPEYLARVFNRSQRYLPYIREELARRDMPLELALLPIVESAYDPFAYSHGRAAGLWQMIPGTARRFGVKQNWWYDGRRDIVDSTRAALDYLEYLHKLNDGDWLNAIASYNSGEGNVLRAVRRNKAAGKPIEFWDLSVPKETSAYVPKLLALVDIVRDPAKYDLTLPAVADEAQFVVADIETQLDLALAAELAGVDVDTVYAYNPGYNRWSTDPAGPHTLVMPVEVAADFSSALDAVPTGERVRWKRHKIGNGETISEIAEQYHTTIASIRAANNLRGNTIRAGQHLLIPVSTKPLTAYSQSADARLERTQNRERKGNKFEHIVTNGESFWTISQRYRVTTRQLAAWNGMAPGDTLSVGKKLVVWSNAEVAPRTSPAGAQANTTRKLNYTVRNGDSLYLIAQRFRVSVNQLVRWNKLDQKKILRPGQRLTMYVDVTAQSS
jgi:membrane-bound lytic murein transglycosylase D